MAKVEIPRNEIQPIDVELGQDEAGLKKADDDGRFRSLNHVFIPYPVVSRNCCNLAALYPTIITLRPSLNTFYLLPTPHLYLS